MPFTPFHFGPGALIKSCAPKYVSFSVFVFSQVIIDIEPLFFLLRGEYPLHRFFHTFPGATAIAVIAYLIGRPFMGLLLALWQSRQNLTVRSFAAAMCKIPRVAAMTGAITGAYTHVFLDSIMHADVQPYMPLSAGNPYLGIISIVELYVYCVLAGMVGAVVLGFWWLVSKVDT